MTDLVVIDASVLLAIALPDPPANKDYAMALLFAIDKGDVAPVLTQLCIKRSSRLRSVLETRADSRGTPDLLVF